jgi:FAD:protein FMN transferase
MNQAYKFGHAAMGTEFDLVLVQPELSPGQAQTLANQIFADIDQLETELSRFKSGSDIWNLNRLSPGRQLSLNLSTWDCLSLAKAVHGATNGALDVTVGKLMQLWRNPDHSLRTPSPAQVQLARQQVGSHLFELIEDGLQVRVLESGLEFDLGAIGKGYALDQSVRHLEEWGVEHALLSAGESSILTLGSPDGDRGWPIELRGSDLRVHWLKDGALSCSGFEVQGQHIMDPRTGHPVPRSRGRSYVTAPTAALSDALSTAFAVMDAAEINEFCAGQLQVKWLDCSDVQV